MLRIIIIALVCIILYNNCAVAETDKSNALATNPYDKIWLMSDYYTLHGYSNESDAFLNYRPYYVTNLQGVDYVYLERNDSLRGTSTTSYIKPELYTFSAVDVNYSDMYLSIVGWENGNTILCILDFDGSVVYNIDIYGTIPSSLNDIEPFSLCLQDIACCDSYIVMLYTISSWPRSDLPSNEGWYMACVGYDGKLIAENYYFDSGYVDSVIFLTNIDGEFYIQSKREQSSIISRGEQSSIIVLDSELNIIDEYDCIYNNLKYSINDVDYYDGYYYLSYLIELDRNSYAAGIAKADQNLKILENYLYNGYDFGCTSRGIFIDDDKIYQNIYVVMEEPILMESENESTIILQHNISCFDEDLNYLGIHESSTVHTYKFVK